MAATTPTTHCSFGPSSMKRRELCPGSYRMEKDLPDAEQSEAAIAGTLYHDEVANMILALKEGREIKEQSEEARMAFNYFFSVVSMYGKNGLQILPEYRMTFLYCGIEQFFGTADVVIVTADKVIIIDWKFGHREVDHAEENSQGAAYALMAMQEFKKEIAEVHFFNPVIKQTTSATFTDRQKIANYLMGVIAKAQEDDAPIIAGEEQCRYCKAMYHGTCPAVAKTAEIAVMDAEKVVPLPALSVLPVEDLCRMKDRCDFIAKLAERVDAEIKRRCEDDGSCGEWRIKESSGGREIKDITGAFSASGMESKTFLECCSVSVSKLEKSYAKQGKEAGIFKTEKEGKEVFNEKLFDFISAKPNKKSLVKGK